MSPPPLARALGLAGLAPQVAVIFVLFQNDPATRYTALTLGYCYAALILSFLGGVWWGLAARAEETPAWLWVAAVIPSLVALAAFPWGFTTSLIVLGTALIAALGVDWRLARTGLAPPWWMSLRVPLSLGLGGLTITSALL